MSREQLIDYLIKDTPNKFPWDKELNFPEKDDIVKLYHRSMKDRHNNLDNAAQLFKNRMDLFSCKDYRADEVKMFTSIGRLVTKLLKDEAFNLYPVKDTNELGKRQFTCRDVFLWAVIFNRKETALFFWRRGKDLIYSSLFASSLMRALSKVADSEEDMALSVDFNENAKYFELLACQVMADLYARSREKSLKLLVKTVEFKSKSPKTIMSLAEENELMDFMATTACQVKLNSIWKAQIAQFTSGTKIILCILVPFFIPTVNFSTSYDEANKTIDVSISQTTMRDSKYMTGKTVDSYINPEVEPFYKLKCCSTSSNSDLNILDALCYFYNAPVTKFWSLLIFYSIYLGIFSFFVLTDLHPLSEKRPSWYEITTWVWNISTFIEELRQVWCREQQSLNYKLRSWWKSAWNKFDAIMYLLFALSVILRFVLSADNFRLTRIAYSITLAIHILRTMHFFYVAKYTGPKVIMIGKMVTDIQFFFMIFAVVLLSFGVVTQANLYPNSEPTWQLLKDVVYLPYWQMFGELFLESVDGTEPSTCTSDPLLFRNGTLPRCPESNSFVPLILAVYMVFTNILLINLLIAMFSYTFQNVQTNAELLWKYYRYSLVHEYYERPNFVPPLIVLNHLYRLARYILHKHTGNYPYTNHFQLDLNNEEEKSIYKLEKWSVDKLLQPTHAQPLVKRSVSSNSSLVLRGHLENLMEDIELIKRKLEYIADEHNSSSPNCSTA